MVSSYVGLERVYSTEISEHLKDSLDDLNIVWPTEEVDCRWFDFNYSGPESASDPCSV